jgi:predicted permease
MPVFTAAIVLLLSIGIGANTLVFSAVNALLLRPLPVSHPAELVRLIEIHPNGFATWLFPYAVCTSLSSSDSELREVLCEGDTELAFSEGASTERVRVELVSSNFFPSLGVSARVGRVLTKEDERMAEMNAVLSYHFWQNHFGGETSALGRRIVLRGRPFEVVGVLPEGFNGLTVDTSPDLYVAASLDRVLLDPYPGIATNTRPLFPQVFARLKPGVSFSRASAEIDPLFRTTYRDIREETFPQFKESGNVLKSQLQLESAARGVSALRRQFHSSLQILMVAVALLLAMTCINVGGLLLARSAHRTSEIATHLALGASRGKILRLLVRESLLLAAMGAAGGMLAATTCRPLLIRSLPPIRDRAAVLQPLAVHLDIDHRVLGFVLAVILMSGILFTIAPGVQYFRVGVASLLNGGRTMTRRSRNRKLVVVIEVAMCTLMVLQAGSLTETLRHLRSVNPGFDYKHVATFTIDPSLVGYKPENARLLSKELLETVSALPGVAAAGIASLPVMRGSGIKATIAETGTRIKPSDFLNSSLNDVTPGYFDAMGMHIVAGRSFSWLGRNSAAIRPAVVNETFARRFCGGQNPIGRRFGFPGRGSVAEPDFDIIGVVSDAKYRSLREPVPPTIYRSVVDGFDSRFVLYVRSRHDPEAVMAPVRGILRKLDPALPLSEVHTLDAEIEQSLWQERLLAGLSTIFGVFVFLLASVGLYGAIDYELKSRSREIAICVALGATRSRIAALVSREVLAVIAAGIPLGLLGSALTAGLVQKMLYGVRFWEPAIIAGTVSLISVVLAAATAPAINRAMATEPAFALRFE